MADGVAENVSEQALGRKNQKKREENGEDLVGWRLGVQIVGGLCNGSQGWFFRRARPGEKQPGRCILSLVADLGRGVMGLHSCPVGEEMLERHFKGQKMALGGK